MTISRAYTIFGLGLWFGFYVNLSFVDETTLIQTNPYIEGRIIIFLKAYLSIPFLKDEKEALRKENHNNLDSCESGAGIGIDLMTPRGVPNHPCQRRRRFF